MGDTLERRTTQEADDEDNKVDVTMLDELIVIHKTPGHLGLVAFRGTNRRGSSARSSVMSAAALYGLTSKRSMSDDKYAQFSAG